MDMQYPEIKTMGGYFQLQLSTGKEYYPNLIKLNTSRNALEYLLEVKNYSKVYVPYFTCEVMLEPLKKLGVAHQFYNINAQLEPIFDFEVADGECLLYNNYLGLKQKAVNTITENLKGVVIDNAQAFFSSPLPGVDTIYSCRKFFGVPDGAYLQLNIDDRLSLDMDSSIYRFSHLIKSIDRGIEASYADFVENEMGLADNDIRTMSRLTQAILDSIDYEFCKSRRIENFNFLHEKLAAVNEFDFEFPKETAAMMYPLLVSKKGIKEKLIENKIFVPTFWPNVFRWTTIDMLEYTLAKEVIYLPVDHRYNLADMEEMLHVLKKLL